MLDVDAVLIGTGLANSIAAAALSKANYKVAHLDERSYYGSHDASLSLNELVQWSKSKPPGFSSISCSEHSLQNPHQYSLSLAPGILPAAGPLIDALIGSGVSKYGGFRLLETINIFHSPDNIEAVPSVKEDVFKSKSLSLLEKRKLMRFLVFASTADWETAKEMAGQENVPFPQFLRNMFSLTDSMISVITYALAFCVTASEPTPSALKRVRAHLRASGRYGPSSFLVGHYGGAGEIAQGFCRASAVSGGVYVLDKAIKDICFDDSTSQYRVELEDFPESITARVLITEESCIAQNARILPRRLGGDYPDYRVARCIIIIDQPILFVKQAAAQLESLRGREDELEGGGSSPKYVDTSLLVFPPDSSTELQSASVLALVTGSDTMSCPQGKWVIYLCTQLLCPQEQQSAQSILEPYLNKILSCCTSTSTGSASTPLFSLFYIEDPQLYDPSPSRSNPSAPASYVVCPPRLKMPHESLDSSTRIGEAIYRHAIGLLTTNGKESEQGEGETNETEESVAGFWPPNHSDDPEDE